MMVSPFMYDGFTTEAIMDQQHDCNNESETELHACFCDVMMHLSNWKLAQLLPRVKTAVEGSPSPYIVLLQLA